MAFDLGEPDLDLIQPGRIGRGEVQFHLGVLLQELLNGWSLMGRAVVENDVDFLPRSALSHHFAQESHEFQAGVTGYGFAMYPSRARVQSRVQGERTMPVVFEAVALGAARREGQNRVFTIQGLDGGLFIHAKNGCVLRRVQVQADDVSGLAFKVGVVAGHIALQPMGFQAGFLPGSMNHILADLQMGGQPAAAPVGGTLVGLLPGSGANSGAQGGSKNLSFLTRVEGIQTLQPSLQKTSFPARNGGRGGLQPLRNEAKGETLGQHQEKRARKT